MSKNELQYHTLPFVSFSYKLIQRKDYEKYAEDMEFTGQVEMPSACSAVTHTFHENEHSMRCLVIVGDLSSLCLSEINQYIVHESVHVKQLYMELIGEDNPSDEFEAYVVDSIYGNMYEDYGRDIGFPSEVVGSVAEFEYDTEGTEHYVND